MIEAGANCNAKDLRMNTPLHLACKGAHLEMVALLLQVPAVNLFEMNLGMKTPLDFLTPIIQHLMPCNTGPGPVLDSDCAGDIIE